MLLPRDHSVSYFSKFIYQFTTQNTQSVHLLIIILFLKMSFPLSLPENIQSLCILIKKKNLSHKHPNSLFFTAHWQELYLMPSLEQITEKGNEHHNWPELVIWRNGYSVSQNLNCARVEHGKNSCRVELTLLAIHITTKVTAG